MGSTRDAWFRVSVRFEIVAMRVLHKVLQLCSFTLLMLALLIIQPGYSKRCPTYEGDAGDHVCFRAPGSLKLHTAMRSCLRSHNSYQQLVGTFAFVLKPATPVPDSCHIWRKHVTFVY